MAKGLSKSRYTLFCKCEKAFWLNVFEPGKATPIDDAQKARFEQGNVVGDLAMELFGPHEEVTTYTPDGKLDLGAMVTKTKDEMQKGTANICEASFTWNGNYCAVDILRKTPGGWAIYEVKSTSYPEFNGSPTQLEKYAPDIAYQKWLLEQCGVTVTDVHLVCLNSDYVRHGALDLNKLFVVVDFDEFIAGEYLLVPGRVARAKEVLKLSSEPYVDLGRHCSKPYECAFWAYCKNQKGLPEPSVFDVYGGSTKSKKEDRFFIDKKLEHYYAGRVSFDDLKGQPLGHVQKLHIEGKEYVDKDGIREFLNTLSYPMYFLDFETMMYAIPQYDGTRPYQQVTFQYSLHIKESESAPYKHKKFLASSNGRNPLPALAKRLCKDIPQDVCVLAYNKTFECSRIKEMADIFPNLRDHLLNIRDNIKDLLDPFQAGYCYMPEMDGSFSIKSVLPALFPGDPQLDYHNLQGSVHNGGEAMDIFPKIKDMSSDDAATARKSLLEYCWLDTWAMVKVWEKLKELTISEIAITSLEQYSAWWTTNHSLFEGQKYTKESLPLLQREYVKELNKNTFNCPEKAIPQMEITPLYRQTNKGILFVNCNPSGTDYNHYTKNNTKSPTDVFMYNKDGNSYFNAAANFADEVGFKDNYAMIDVFPIVIQNQVVLKEAFMNPKNEKLRKAFKQLLVYCREKIVAIQPEIIVATNAFVKDIFTDDNNWLELNECKKDKKKICYSVKIGDFTATLFCGGMIAGGHQMDTESKERLIRDVKLFHEHQSIQF